jgi:hypothetical protein
MFLLHCYRQTLHNSEDITPYLKKKCMYVIPKNGNGATFINFCLLT